MIHKNSIIIRKANAEDLSDIHKLVEELALYERAPEEVITTPDSYWIDFERGWFEAVIAADGPNIIGMALYHKAYSTWKGPMIYLEDLIVTNGYRRLGIGSLLMEELIKISKEMRAQSIKWQVLDWNAPAIGFYKKYKVLMDPTWVNCRLFLDEI
jgi:ribosomal protein S18 acetylase RimI-like enzyme